MSEISKRPAKRIKKENVTPEQGKDWLDRLDSGEKIKDIAKSDGYDVRTVKRRVGEARQEKDRYNARIIVIQNALENHYRDLVKFAQKIEKQVNGEKQIALEDNRLWLALRQHMPHSPLWIYLKNWDRYIEDRKELREKAAERLADLVKQDPAMKNLLAANPEAAEFMVTLLLHQLEAWAKGLKGLNLKDNIAFQTQGDGSTILNYGPYFLIGVTESLRPDIESLISKYEGMVRTGEEYESFRKIYTEMAQLKAKIYDEIALITLRRVLPGKCRYCPI